MSCEHPNLDLQPWRVERSSDDWAVTLACTFSASPDRRRSSKVGGRRFEAEAKVEAKQQSQRARVIFQSFLRLFFTAGRSRRQRAANRRLDLTRAWQLLAGIKLFGSPDPGFLRSEEYQATRRRRAKEESFLFTDIQYGGVGLPHVMGQREGCQKKLMTIYQVMSSSNPMNDFFMAPLGYSCFFQCALLPFLTERGMALYTLELKS